MPKQISVLVEGIGVGGIGITLGDMIPFWHIYPYPIRSIPYIIAGDRDSSIKPEMMITLEPDSDYPGFNTWRIVCRK